MLIVYVICRILFLFFPSLWGALLLPLESTGKRGHDLTSSSQQHNLYLVAPQSVCVSINFINFIVVFIFLNNTPLRGRPSTVVSQEKKIVVPYFKYLCLHHAHMRHTAIKNPINIPKRIERSLRWTCLSHYNQVFFR